MTRILVLYNGQSMYTPTVQDYMDAFQRYSKHEVRYLHVSTDTLPEFSMQAFEAVLITYSCRLCYIENMSPSVRDAIRDFSGVKVAFVQDEYQETNKLKAALQELGIGIVFTCVPRDKITWVYPPAMFPGVEFHQVLTGYVPDRLRQIDRTLLPKIADRPIAVGYRGRHLGYCWGDLSYYKYEIGRRFRAACERRGIAHDIDWTETSRIYQDQWYPFIASCRSTLGTPSGLNVFDFDGNLEREYRRFIGSDPDACYWDYRPRIAGREAEIDMGQVSPRVFEAAALGTVLVLLEGSYSGAVTPGIDCIEVKRDFSNIDAVLDQVSDVAYLERLAEAAYANIIDSDAWSYRRFIEFVDGKISGALGPARQSKVSGWGGQVRSASFEQYVCEETSLRAPVQAPTAHWLDLSHQRHVDVASRLVVHRIVDDAKRSMPGAPTPRGSRLKVWGRRAVGLVAPYTPPGVKRVIKRWIQIVRHG